MFVSSLLNLFSRKNIKIEVLFQGILKKDVRLML